VDAISSYFYQILLRPGSGEFALRVMFKYCLFTDKPIVKMLPEMKRNGIEVSFYFGSKDWMDNAYGGEKVSDTLKGLGEKVYIIENSDHQLALDNPVHF